MASDRNQYNRALRKWDALHAANAYSVPNDEGSVAILCSDYEAPLEDSGEATGEQMRAFEDEAEAIAVELALVGIQSQLYRSYTAIDAIDVLKDPDFSTVLTIGNGNLSSSYDSDGYSIDWRFVSEYATHLKTGRFVQRHCGQSIREMSVPFGTFAMSRHSDVYAAHNVTLPTVMTDDYEDKIRSLHDHARIGYRTLKSLFPQIQIDKDEVILDMSDLSFLITDRIGILDTSRNV